MAYIGGDFREITCSHPVLGDLRLSPKSNEDFNIVRGGIGVNDDANSITGDGKNIKIMNVTRWSVEGPIAVDMLDGEELELLNQISAHPIEGNWTFTHISGAIYRGIGSPVGEGVVNTNSATRTLKVAGGGLLEQI